MAASSVIPSEVDEYFELGAETAPIDALIVLSQALDRLAAEGAAQQRTITMPASIAGALILMLVDYRRLLEEVGAQIAALPTPQQRDAALTAYQNVCQFAFNALAAIELVRGAP